MDEALTNEAAEMIGLYLKKGKESILPDFIKRGGIIRKEIEANGRYIHYYYPDGGYSTFDFVRLSDAKETTVNIFKEYLDPELNPYEMIIIPKDLINRSLVKDAPEEVIVAFNAYKKIIEYEKREGITL